MHLSGGVLIDVPGFLCALPLQAVVDTLTIAGGLVVFLHECLDSAFGT